MNAPGAYQPLKDRLGRFDALYAALATTADLAVLVDPRVGRLHRHLERALKAHPPLATVRLAAGERTKSLQVLEKVLGALSVLPRTGTLLAVGGGTIGDLATVAAHLHKRGVRLVQVPTTLLAAVDSSVGGKGAVNLGAVKNAAGVFHYPAESWLCPELFETLGPAQLREGRVEAWKAALCLSPKLYASWRERPPSHQQLIHQARIVKAKVCAKDPYEQKGLRQVLNFGHTFGHVLESLTDFRLRHGEAVGLGLLCALDVGRALGITPAPVANEVERTLREARVVRSRKDLARAFARGDDTEIAKLLGADKKTERPGQTRMVLLERVGRWKLQDVPARSWKALLPAWREGRVP
jgi:3-dehydroquinate synthase